ncbi:hypothetical protein HNV11_05290 [Spirosoma taeanense]|uniref:Uncharacterized protein n=1 Tax=Spirosoma taeanense TaxID=2735870 RepID=A0A6M5Y2E9_9BACT|nr:hypothetical protein [Spirosoma taeanense]QJW88837.1 hypothetical protein HNV11_05290 [Spirosoma taeanense]
MRIGLGSMLVGALWLAKAGYGRPGFDHPAPDAVQPIQTIITADFSKVHYQKLLRFNIYSFHVTATDSGAVRNLRFKAYRGALLLTNFQTRVDGAVVGAEVADLDGNRYPELYVYSSSEGSGSFGRVYGWQFLAERKADISAVNWQSMGEGYMGHDSLWVERTVLCRKFPVYRPGDVNARPTGGQRMVRYRLRTFKQGFVLMAD